MSGRGRGLRGGASRSGASLPERHVSEREQGEKPRVLDGIDERIWKGIRDLIESRIRDGSLAKRFPRMCEDSPVICGTDAAAFHSALGARFPEFELESDQPCPASS